MSAHDQPTSTPMTGITDAAGAVDQYADVGLDRTYLIETLSQLARVPTDVPPGFQTLMEPDDPKLVHYVQDVLRPELVRLGAYDLIDAPRNNVIVRLGRGTSGRVLLLQNYTPTQHNNLMPAPFSGRIANASAYGCDEPAVFGQGVSQNKAHQAVMLAVLKWLLESDTSLSGCLYWAINNEGRSSHACSEAILAALPTTPEFCVLQMGTALALSLGNRGRVDVDVHVVGRAAHSSVPQEGLSAIDGAHAVIQRLKALSWPQRHPLLGGRHAIVYKARYEPQAPHTLPSDAYLTVDCRLLPGDDPDEAVEDVRSTIGDLAPYEVSVARGVFMLPALVDPEDPSVCALQEANKAIRGKPAPIEYGQGTFDAGGLCARGIPTIMFGASGETGLLDTDFVPISAVEIEAKALAYFIWHLLS